MLTPQLIRMEWSEDGVFEDHPTLTFVNRRLPVPDFKVSYARSKVVIRTSVLTLTYKPEGKFSSDNLKVEFDLSGQKVVWIPGMNDDQNLMGTTRTLDGCDGSKLGREPMEKYVENLKAAGQKAELVIIEDAEHAFFDWKPDQRTKATFAKYGVPYAADMMRFFDEVFYK